MQSVPRESHVRKDGSECRCSSCTLPQPLRARVRDAREALPSRGPVPPGLVGTGLPSESCRCRSRRNHQPGCTERAWHQAAVSAYVEWFRPLPVQLWLTINAREPLGIGGWRYVLRLVSELVEERAGERGQTAWLGAVEPNRDRELCHLHALGMGPTSLREPRRTGPDGLISAIAQLVTPLHSGWRPYQQPDNRGSATLRAVRSFGNGPDSLTAYFVKYSHKERDAAQIEVGDVGRFLHSVPVTLC